MQRQVGQAGGADVTPLVADYWLDPDDGNGLTSLTFTSPLTVMQDALVDLCDAIVVGGVVVVVFWWSVHRSRTGQLTVATLRPGWRLHGVWADESLGRELVKQGVWEAGLRPVGGSRLTVAWSTWGIELWRGGRAPYVVVPLPWSAVASTTEGSGHAASSARPAVVVTTLIGASLVLVRSARGSGGVLPASTAQVQGLVTALRTVRDGG